MLVLLYKVHPEASDVNSIIRTDTFLVSYGVMCAAHEPAVGVEHTVDGFDIGVCPTAQVRHRFLRIPAEDARVGVAVLIGITATQAGVAGIALRGRGRRIDLVRVDRYFF